MTEAELFWTQYWMIMERNLDQVMVMLGAN